MVTRKRRLWSAALGSGASATKSTATTMTMTTRRLWKVWADRLATSPTTGLPATMALMLRPTYLRQLLHRCRPLLSKSSSPHSFERPMSKFMTKSSRLPPSLPQPHWRHALTRPRLITMLSLPLFTYLHRRSLRRPCHRCCPRRPRRRSILLPLPPLSTLLFQPRCRHALFRPPSIMMPPPPLHKYLHRRSLHCRPCHRCRPHPCLSILLPLPSPSPLLFLSLSLALILHCLHLPLRPRFPCSLRLHSRRSHYYQHFQRQPRRQRPRCHPPSCQGQRCLSLHSHCCRPCTLPPRPVSVYRSYLLALWRRRPPRHLPK